MKVFTKILKFFFFFENHTKVLNILVKYMKLEDNGKIIKFNITMFCLNSHKKVVFLFSNMNTGLLMWA